ncbi:importin-13 isoform X1 [Neodiprion pinetum]|uniref:Importin-13 isoform X1 n=1 Tax=Neodiprion lecontei TaxID=441921 RepID=A0A6J0C8R3_NEOLC|nr:importin-13 isoform X1 [Neodiprion lecontei]XP_046480628.1 importin-13 isoform X1 [Neodiprion pinetum]
MDRALTVEEAVMRFYATGTSETHSWLLQIQASFEAWSFVWDLIEPTKSWEVQCFGATTLYSKLTKQWDQVPKNEYLVLKDRLLDGIKKTEAPMLVLSKLCQALAVVLINIQASEEGRKESKSLVEDVISNLSCDTPLMLDLLLRVLSALPVEFENCHGTTKTKIRQSLIASWQRVALLLLDVFSNLDHVVAGRNNQKIFLLGLECALSWLKLGEIPLEATSHLFKHFLQAALHYAPRREIDLEASSGWEVVQECLNLTLRNPALVSTPVLLWEWTEGLIWSVRQECGQAFYDILGTFGHAHSRTFLLALSGEGDEKKKWAAKQLVELLLECSELPGRYPTEERSSCIPFGFWYSLQDDFYVLDPPVEARALLALKPVYARLAQALLRKATLPLSAVEAGDEDDRELLRCYRQDAADTLAYCYNVLGVELLELLGQRLSQPPDNFDEWNQVESTLHAFKALSGSIESHERRYIPPLLSIVLSEIPYHRYPGEVLSSACTAIGAYAEWIGEHPDPWLEGCLRLVALGLAQGPVTATAASMALKDLARECGPHLAPLAPSVLETIGCTLPNVPPGGCVGLRLMYAAGKLLNSLPSTDLQLQHLDSTLGPCVRRLHELLQLPPSKARGSVVNQLKMATTLFSTLEGHVGKAVLDGLVPLFNRIVTDSEWGKDYMTLEAMHICVQKSLSSLPHPKAEARPLLLLLTTSYKTTPHPAALNLLRQLVLALGRDSCSIIAPVFAELNGYTLNGVAAIQTAGGNLSDLSDLLQAYLVLLAQICKKTSQLLLDIPQQIPETLRCGIACLSLPEVGIAKAAGSFLSHAIGQCPHLKTFIETFGQELVCTILRCVGGDVARCSLEPHAEVLLELCISYHQWTTQWLRVALSNANAPPVSQERKDTFIRDVLRVRRNKGRLCDILKDFGLVCRQSTPGLIQ